MNLYDFWQKRISKSYPLFKGVLEKYIGAGSFREDDRILDFGCGTGKYCTFFNPRNYIGIDVSDKNLGIARRNYPEYRFFKLQNGPQNHQLNFKDRYFQFILILGVFHHISNDDLKIILVELRRLLKENGKIFLLEPILSETSKRLNKWMQFVDRGKHFRREKDLLGLIEPHFKVKEKEQFITELFYNEKVYELGLRKEN